MDPVLTQHSWAEVWWEGEVKQKGSELVPRPGKWETGQPEEETVWESGKKIYIYFI